MFVEQQNWAQSQAYCEQALPLYIEERDVLGQASTLRYLGRTLFELGEYQQGIGHMQQAIELFHRIQDKEWEGYTQQELAEMQERLDLAENSDETAQRPLSVVPIQRSLAALLSAQGRYQETLEPLQAAIQLLQAEEGDSEDTAQVLSGYAYTLGKLGRLEEALSAYGEAITLLPDAPGLYRNRAETLIQARHLDEAEADLARAVALEEAEQMLAKTNERDENLDITFVQAQSAWLRGDVPTAVQTLQEVFGQANQGDRAAVQREMTRLLAEHPDLPGRDAIAAIWKIQ